MNLTEFAGAAGLIASLALLRAALARRTPARREYARDLRFPLRALIAHVAARVGEQLAESGSAAHRAFHAAALLLLAVALLRMAETALFFLAARFAERPTPRIVRSLIAWASTFLAAALVLRAEYHFDLGSLFATSALLSVVLGFALQETLGNLFAGLTLNAERPFEPGEWVSFGKYTGRVLDVGWRSTRLLTADEDELLVPNSLISREVVVNHLRPQLTDVIEIVLPVDLDVAPARARATLLEAVRGCEVVLADPAPVVQLASFAENAAQYRVRFHTAGYHLERRALDEVQEAIWYALRRAGIEMPYPQVTVSQRERAAEAEARRKREHRAEAEDLFSRIDFVEAMSGDARGVLFDAARFVEFGPGQKVVKQGEPGETLYLVARGELAVRVQLESGEREVARLGRGALFGEMSVLTGEPRSATVVALGDAALLAVDRDAFHQILSREPALAKRLAEVIARRKLALDEARAGAPASPLVEREASSLLDRIGAVFGFASSKRASA